MHGQPSPVWGRSPAISSSSSSALLSLTPTSPTDASGRLGRSDGGCQRRVPSCHRRLLLPACLGRGKVHGPRLLIYYNVRSKMTSIPIPLKYWSKRIVIFSLNACKYYDIFNLKIELNKLASELSL